MKETMTYLIKRNDVGDDLYITNRPSDNFPDIKYSTNRRDAKDFDGMDNAVIDMTKHTAIKKTVTETTEYEEVEYD
ncbi:DUF2483 family protein [Staphylococcus warneri]|uniref:DUF2483 family protein n=1 Tax=Staphylococcus warneri TaxID=1292 RepID=UPI001072B385|nr:DUF2483 family protein [Staphylococcus warneri]MBF0770349.1 DUF2483 family protein [Staphylococcus warneri]MCI2747140.1 DUF2483 domain-containing protein [Staphylococcus warneri]MCI2767731.1 DUF2483 domain-containing protein [Staphylococcus warneri]MCI2777481.1 DUF2483 domain-containing protein [Staphylococcus warneri]MCI2787040.1 DUF2483 domain-containing protein [Staphylococcus warneri]